jgi:hypothetical protein
LDKGDLPGQPLTHPASLSLRPRGEATRSPQRVCVKVFRTQLKARESGPLPCGEECGPDFRTSLVSNEVLVTAP